MINGSKGTYRLWLNQNSRDRFHEILRTCLEEFLIVKDTDTNPSSQWQDKKKSKDFLNDLLSTQQNARYYQNSDPFDCIVCMGTIAKGEGILFRKCLHPFCKQCLLQLIETSTEPTIKCPHDNCDMLLEERELRGVRITQNR